MRLFLLLIAVVIAGCGSQSQQMHVANPASKHCVQQGGAVVIQKNGEGGEFGVCVFEDNRQCEEWAFYRGNCPKGGVKVTGYVTDAARYCAITGGTYRMTAGQSGSIPEQGTCTRVGGVVCDVYEFYAAKCPARK